MRDGEETVSFTDVTVSKATSKALLCVIDGDEYWIPKSQISQDSEVFNEDSEGTLIVSQWIAGEKGLG